MDYLDPDLSDSDFYNLPDGTDHTNNIENGLPEMLKNESKNTSRGKAILDGYNNDLLHTRGLRKPFYYHDRGFIMLQNPYNGINAARVYIPDHFIAEGENQSSIRLMLIEAIHELLGHARTDKTWTKLRKSVYWPLMYDDVKGYCQTCDTCQRNKQPTTKPAGPARTMPIPSRPWESIAIDFMGPFNTSSGYKNIMVIQDRFSAAIIIEPLPDKYSAKDVADVMFKRYYGHYGFPASILSDRNPRFL